MIVEVARGEAVLVTRFGRLLAPLVRPGWHWLPDRMMPWTKVVAVSLRRTVRELRGIRIVDARGLAVEVDLWIELRVVDPVATLQVDDWHRALELLVTSAATAQLGRRELAEILADRDAISDDIVAGAARWGVAIERVLVKHVAASSGQQHFDAIVAQLERERAEVEERGRHRVATVHIAASSQIATLVGEARGQHPAAIGRAYAELKKNPAVFAAYTELFALEGGDLPDN